MWDAAIGGERIVLGANPYRLTQLDYDPTTSKVNLFVEAKTFNTQFTKLQGLEDSAQPDDRILVTAYRDYGGPGLRVPYAKDSVKYAVVQANTIYPEMVGRQEVRHELASRGVYGDVLGGGLDLPKFGLKKLSPVEPNKLGLLPQITSQFGGTSTAPGLVVELYKDHSGADNQFVLAFRGTDASQFDDLYTDVWQGIGGFTLQYEKAMEIAAAIRVRIGQPDSQDNVNFLKRGQVTTTGHSLGGGLASAAAVVGSFRADTFNAAGLKERTLRKDNDPTQVERYSGSLARYANANAWINAYYVDWDLLHLIQSIPGVQPAVGTMIEMDGPFDIDLTFYASMLTQLPQMYASGVGWTVAAAYMGLTLWTLADAHMNSAVLYGLLVEESSTGTVVRDLLGYSF